MALSTMNVPVDSRVEPGRSNTRQGFASIGVLAGAVILLMIASAVVQAIGYVSSGLAMPDAVTAAPALLGIILLSSGRLTTTRIP